MATEVDLNTDKPTTGYYGRVARFGCQAGYKVLPP